jgi:thymidylate synthase
MNTLKQQFDRVVDTYKNMFLIAPVIEGQKWQSTKAPADMVELFNQSFSLQFEPYTSLETLREAIKPNLPWADRHFEEERVSGEPVNPGETWKIWPYAKSAETHIRGKQYDHSYAERYWPKFAGNTPDGRLTDSGQLVKRAGIRFPLGDLSDLVDVLVEDPLTRQAYLPIFFPEDLGAAKKSARVPCTLGYHFIRRNGMLHVYYPMRSCDFIRHFRDDVYLTSRLLIWVLEECVRRSPENWENVSLGTFRMHTTSLHMFVPDRQMLKYNMDRGL